MTSTEAVELPLETKKLISAQSAPAVLNSIKEETVQSGERPAAERQQSSSDDDDGDGYINMSSSSAQAYHAVRPLATTPSTPCSDFYSHITHPKPAPNANHMPHVPELIERVRELQERETLLEIIITRYQRENTVLQTQLKRYTQRASGDVLDSKNIIYEFGTNEVQALLDKMGLSKYVIAFAIEKIDGPLFLELDEEVLEHELGVKSVLHRRRMMRVILGEDHINDVMRNKVKGRRATTAV